MSGGKAEASALRLEDNPRERERPTYTRPAQEAQNHHGGTGRGVPGQRLAEHEK